MTTKLLVIGDIHWRATNPVARLDNLKLALADKLLECWEIAKSNNVDAIVQTGDFFHSPGIVYSTLADLIWLLREAPAPIYCVPGNHDLFASSPESLYRTPLGFLIQIGMVHNLDGKTVLLGENSLLSGRGYDAAVDADPVVYAYPVQSKFPQIHAQKTNIHVTHGMLVKEPVPGRHTLMHSLLELERAPDVLINGHFHLGTGVTQVGPTLVVNPGALCRLSAHMEELNRQPEVALVAVESYENYNVSVSAKLIPLQSAKPGHEVLSREHLEKQAEIEQRRDEFLRLLASEETQRVLDLAEMVRDIASRERLPKTVQDEALRRIARAQEMLTGAHEKKEDG